MRSMQAAIALALVVGCARSDPQPDDRIGEVLGTPVYRHELPGEAAVVREELARIFVTPVMEQYREENQASVEPTNEEIDRAWHYLQARNREETGDVAQLQKQLQQVERQLQSPDLAQEERLRLESEMMLLQVQITGPDREVAYWILAQWKFQKHLYEAFGGGRILFQQGGTEAFDAMRRWLAHQESRGKLVISDRALRDKLLEYWTTQDHGAFLTRDPASIREFLEPPWTKPPVSAQP